MNLQISSVIYTFYYGMDSKRQLLYVWGQDTVDWLVVYLAQYVLTEFVK